MAMDDDNSQGVRGVLQDPKHYRADARMARVAIRDRWEIPPEARKIVPLCLIKLLDVNQHDPRTVVAAARALIEADKANLMADKMRDGDEEPGDLITMEQIAAAMDRQARSKRKRIKHEKKA